MNMEDSPLTPPVGASAWDREMFTFLTDHVRLESAMLSEYMRTADATGSKALSYVMDILINDERRHHRFFVELASSLKTEAELSGAEPVVPRLDFDKADTSEVLAITDELLAHEKEDLVELKRLRKDLRDVAHVTLWGLLVDIMMRDTEKHIAILQFVKRHARTGRADS